MSIPTRSVENQNDRAEPAGLCGRHRQYSYLGSKLEATKKKQIVEPQKDNLERNPIDRPETLTSAGSFRVGALDILYVACINSELQALRMSSALDSKPIPLPRWRPCPEVAASSGTTNRTPLWRPGLHEWTSDLHVRECAQLSM